MADKILTELVINRGTKQKFDDLPTKSPDELYFITDGDYFATKTDLNAKQDVITDLDTIRSGAELGATALQSVPSEYITETELANYHDSTKQDVATAVNYDNISNCITEIPQDIILELNNGTLTLKASSKVYVPNGAGVFDLITTTQDCSLSGGIGANNTKLLIAYKNNSITTRSLSLSVSGPGATTSGGFAFDTTANKIHFYNSSGVLQSSNWSLPIAIVSTDSSGVASSIDQVFNGFGYIGSTVFTLPGLKGLYPNGRNADGTLKNGNVICNSVQISSTFTATEEHVFILQANGRVGWYNRTDYIYDKENNYIYNANAGIRLNSCVVGTFSVVNSKVQNFKPFDAFHALDYNDSEYIAHQAMPSDRYIDLTRGSESPITLTAPADGYYVLLDEASTNNSTIRATVYPSALYYYCYSGGAGTWFGITCHVSKGQQVIFYFNTSDTNRRFRFVYANGSK